LWKPFVHSVPAFMAMGSDPAALRHVSMRDLTTERAGDTLVPSSDGAKHNIGEMARFLSRLSVLGTE